MKRSENEKRILKTRGAGSESARRSGTQTAEGEQHAARRQAPGAQMPQTPRAEARAEAGIEAQLCGVGPVLEALRAGNRPVERIMILEGAHESRLRELLGLANAAGVPVRRATRFELDRLAAGVHHQGVVASVSAASYRDADELLDALAARVGGENPPLAIVLDGVEDPRNLGAIIRTAECAGAHGIFIPERRAVGLTETVAKTAAGALEYVPVARVANVVRLIEQLKERGIWTVGAVPEATTDHTAWDWAGPSAVFFGSEAEGLRRLVRERCDALVRIPMHGHIESLNVSVAAGVVLFEAVRQRTAVRAATYKAGQGKPQV